MTATKGLGTYGNAVGTVTPLDHKMAQLGLVAKTAANTIRPGLFWDGSATIVSGKANMSYEVRALSAVTSRGATAGAVLLTNDATYNVVTTAAPGSNSRYDVVYIWQREYSLDGTDSNPVIGVVQGTAAASPTVPSLASFPGAIELARILVPAGVTATNSGTTITQTGTFTAAQGGVIPFRNTTERDAGTYLEGQLGWLIDSDIAQQYDGSTWRDTRSGLIPIVPTVAGSGVSVAASGKVTLTAATTADIRGLTGGFDKYQIELTGDTITSLGVQLQVMSGASAITTSTYDRVSSWQTSTTTTVATDTAQTSWYPQVINSATVSDGTIIVSNLASGKPTTIRSEYYGVTAASGANAFQGTMSGSHRTATAYDGLKFTFSAAWTGTIRVYALSNN